MEVWFTHKAHGGILAIEKDPTYLPRIGERVKAEHYNFAPEIVTMKVTGVLHMMPMGHAPAIVHIEVELEGLSQPEGASET